MVSPGARSSRRGHRARVSVVRDQQAEKREYERIEGFGPFQQESEERSFKAYEPQTQTFVRTSEQTEASAASSKESNSTRLSSVVNDPLSKFSPFQFVNIDGGRPRSPASKAAARAHVMRRVCKERDDARKFTQTASRGRKLGGASSSSTNASENPSTCALSAHASRVSSQADFSATSGGQMASLNAPAPLGSPRSLGLNYEPPWRSNATPALHPPKLGLQWAIDMKHIHHYIQVFAKSLIPMDVLEEARWFWKALDDEVCYHSTLFVSRAHQAFLSGREPTLDADCYSHKEEAINRINKRLSKHEEATSDGTIAAIACLAAYENLYGSRELVTAHLHGLETLIKLRRGFHGTDMSAFLERVVQCIELSHASAVRLKSRFFPQDQLSRDTFEIACADSTILTQAWNPQWGNFTATTITFTAHKGMTPAAATTFYRIQQLSHIRAQIQCVRNMNAETLYFFTRNVSLLERHINTIINWDKVRDCTQPAQCMPLYGSMLVFIYVVLRDIPANSPFFANFVIRFKRVLGAMGLEAFCEHFSDEIFLWVLFLMTWIAQEREDRPWYFSSMAWLIRRLRLYTWEQAKEVLAEYCIVECVCEVPYRKLWFELENNCQEAC